MEYGLHETLPIYSGGRRCSGGRSPEGSLGFGFAVGGCGPHVWAGFFTQHISEDGWQEAINNELDFEDLPAIPVLADDGSA